MLGSNIQKRAASRIRESRLEEIRQYAQFQNFLLATRIPTIVALLEAQQDAGWWIDNQNTSSRSLMLWAAAQGQMLPDAFKPIDKFRGSIFLLAVPRLISFSENQDILNEPVLVIDSQKGINSNSQIVDFSITAQETGFGLALSVDKPSNPRSETLRRLLQVTDGGWATKNWSFLTLSFQEDEYFFLEGMSGELIIALSRVRELLAL